MNKHREFLEWHYSLSKDVSGEMSRLEYVADYIFDFTTYDSELSELMALKALEVCDAISNGTTFEYIKDVENYHCFIVMCNMPFFADKLEWGTSIRGAWWQFSQPEVSICDHVVKEREWKDFLSSVAGFVK